MEVFTIGRKCSLTINNNFYVFEWNRVGDSHLDGITINVMMTVRLGGVKWIQFGWKLCALLDFVLAGVNSCEFPGFFFFYLTFICPCVFNIFAEYNQQDTTFLNLFISLRCSTYFRRFFRPSAGARNCTYRVGCLSDQYTDQASSR